MPRLLTFGVCQKAIVSKFDDSISMINLLFGCTVTLDDLIPIQDVAVPFEWAAVSAWLIESNDNNKTYEQKINIYYPNGASAGESIIAFKFNARSHQNMIASNNFPVGQAGEYILRLSVRELANEEEEWKIVSEYPFEVIHIKKP